MMQEKEPMSRADFETILWPEIKEKIIPHLGNEFKAYDRNKEVEGKFFYLPGLYDADICGISKVYRLDKKTQEAQKSTELEDENDEAAEQDSEDSLENEPEDAEILDSEMEELKEDLGGSYNFI